MSGRRPTKGRQSTAINHPNPLLKAPLEAALSSLDVQLEEELARYRLQRTGRSTPSNRSAKFIFGRKDNPDQDLDLISLKFPEAQARPQIAASNQPSIAMPSWEQNPSLSLHNSAISGLEHQPVDIQNTSQSTPTSTHASQTNECKSQVPLVNHASRGDLDRQGNLEQDTDTSLALDANAKPMGQLAMTPPSEPDDYLQSSEELLKSLADGMPIDPEPTSQTQQKSGLKSMLLTPLGVGSMLLLLVSCATLGFVIMNPSVLGHLQWAQLIETDEADNTSETTTQTVESEAAPTGTDQNQAQSPDLSAREFVPLNLQTLSTLQTESSLPGAADLGQDISADTHQDAKSTADVTAAPTGQQNAPATPNGIVPQAPNPAQATGTAPSVAAAPTAAPAPSNPRPAVPSAPSRSTSSGLPTLTPAQSTPRPSNSSVPSTSKPATVTSSATAEVVTASSGDFHYVVTDYSGDPALEAARAVVGDAYVRNFSAGAKIQLGAFSDPNQAQEWVQELQERGIPAQVQRP
ncbi:MAG: hypothetical protein F6K19_07810 [Cyanothece sp. SIO1E1]|nr:hypothetical protein [Cyanothece sp. SIO1E1]